MFEGPARPGGWSNRGAVWDHFDDENEKLLCKYPAAVGRLKKESFPFNFLQDVASDPHFSLLSVDERSGLL